MAESLILCYLNVLKFPCTTCLLPLTSLRTNQPNGWLMILCLVSQNCCTTSLLAFELLNLVFHIKCLL